jgi:prophage regulatory protein
MAQIIRKSQLQEFTGLSPRHIDRLEKAGKFPSRLQLGPKSVGWYENEISEWLNNRIRGPALAPLSATASSVAHLDEIINSTLKNIARGTT